MTTTPTSRVLRLANKSGFTLLELVVAIAVIALIIGLSVGGLNQYLERDMRKTASKLATTIRYLYNKSVTDSIYMRLVIDMDENTYWVEATGDPLLLADPRGLGRGEEERALLIEKAKEEIEEKKPLETTETKEAKEGEKEKPTVPQKLLPQQASFNQITDYLLKPTPLPDSVFFKDVAVEHYPTAVEGGKVTIAFFPNGYVEAAIINIRNDDDDVHYSLKTNPVTGRVSVEAEYRRFEDE